MSAAKAMKNLIEGQVNLPSPPAIAVKIMNVVQAEDFSLDDLEEVITADPALTGKMLRIANSAYYALPNPISNVNRALSVLGSNVIKNIALSFVIAGDLRKSTGSSFNFDYFWKRSVTTAVATELLTATLEEDCRDIFVTALLQDIGILIFHLNKGSEYDQILKDYLQSGSPLFIAEEQELFQVDHQELSYLLLENWGLPDSIIKPILYHHQPQKAPSKELQKSAAILETADLLSIIYSGTETSVNFRALCSKMEEHFSITAEKTQEILDTVAIKSIEMLQVFDLDPGDMKPYSQILQEANDELGKLNLSYEQLVLELKESKLKAERFADELRKANKKLEELAFRDGLTGLYNHRYFQEILDKEIARSARYKHPLGLILFDIDFFKKVNDTYGHPAGDLVLATMAKTLLASIRPSDIIARYGGEEFAVILPETDISGIKVFAERIRRGVAAMIIPVHNTEISVTISCGITYRPIDSSLEKQQLIDNADQALYLSKKNGRNQVTQR